MAPGLRRKIAIIATGPRKPTAGPKKMMELGVWKFLKQFPCVYIEIKTYYIL